MILQNVNREEKRKFRIVYKEEDAPFVIKHKGLYYLTYSANHTRCVDYCAGYAVLV